MSDPKKKEKKAQPARPKLQTPTPKKRVPVKRKAEHSEAIRSVATPAAPAVSPAKKYQNVLQGAIWVLVLGLAGLIALALATFNVQDPSFWRGIPSTVEVHNRAGLIGAYLADTGYYGLGLSIWWLVVAAFVWLYRHFRSGDGDAHSFLLFGVGLGMILFCSPMVERLLLLGKLNHVLQQDAGGWVGAMTTEAFTMYLGKGGSLFILVVLIAVGMKLLVQFSYRELAVQLWQKGKQQLDYLLERNQPPAETGDTIAPSTSNVQIKQPWLQKLSGSLKMGKKANKSADKPSSPSDTQSEKSDKKAAESSDNNGKKRQSKSKKQGVSSRLLDATRQVFKQDKRKQSTPSAQTDESSPDTDWSDSDEVLEDGVYRLPSVNLLRENASPEVETTLEMLLPTGNLIVEKLAEFGIKVEIADAICGPVITRYELRLDKGVKGSQIVNLSKDLARSMAVQSVRVVETIVGKNTMGIELPNEHRREVLLRDILSNHLFKDSASKLTVALGVNIAGGATIADLAKMPHLLVGGMTGSGKSVGVNAMIMSILYKAKPEEVRFIMIDPKMLELSVYDGIPHLLCPVVTDMKEAGNALNWCVAEMEKRFRTMMHLGVRNLASFNAKVQAAIDAGEPIANPFSLTPETPEPLQVLPQIVIVIDELADLMMTEKKAVETQITRIAQKARAAGMHMIIATQRPSVDVITGLIKANVPTRMAFTVQSKIDSRTILDQMGAEDLLKNGDLLFLQPGNATPTRLQGAFVSDDEVHQVVSFIKAQGEPNYVEGLLTGEALLEHSQFLPPDLANKVQSDKDELFGQAVEFVVTSRKTSISSLQRNLRIGYNRAANLMQLLEDEGVISPAESNGTRRILLTKEQLGS